MNIKEHIEAGHYPTDDKGRALVPMRGSDTFVVCATDKPRVGDRHHCIIGWHGNGLIDAFDEDGATYGHPVLLPPPPRKVKVTRWVLMRTDADGIWRDHFDDRHQAEMCAACYPGSKWTPVELTGEYEEEWKP